MIDSNLTTNGDRMYTVPKVSDVARWDVISHGEGVFESEAAVYYNSEVDNGQDFYKVLVPDQRPKYFKGETAWMDSRRYADDARFNIRMAKD